MKTLGKYIGIPFILFFLISLESNAQNKLSVIQGTVDNVYAKEAILYKVVKGQTVKQSSQDLNEEKGFAFALPNPKEGYYYLRSDRQRKDDLVRIYLRGGENLTVEIKDEGYTLSSSSPENKLLYQWYQTAAPILKAARLGDTATYRSFFPNLKKLLPKAKAFKKEIHTKNEKFNNFLKYTIDHDIEMAAMTLLLTPRQMHPKRAQYPDYYNTIIKPKKFCTTKILDFGDGQRTLSMYSTFVYLMNYDKDNNSKKESQEVHLKKNLKLFCNDTIKGVVLINSLRGYKDYGELVKAVTPFKQYLVTQSLKEEYMDIEKSLRSFKAGTPAFNFAYKDTSGHKVSLEDLKGKVVYLDVWATWCAPCRQELPYLDSLETAMKDLDIAFVSLSIDEDKDIDKWKKMVKEDHMQGYQLHADGAWASDLVKYYGIHAIPRFMIFDQEGNIVTIDSPRPSNPELVGLLKETLNNG